MRSTKALPHRYRKEKDASDEQDWFEWEEEDEHHQFYRHYTYKRGEEDIEYTEYQPACTEVPAPSSRKSPPLRKNSDLDLDLDSSSISPTKPIDRERVGTKEENDPIKEHREGWTLFPSGHLEITRDMIYLHSSDTSVGAVASALDSDGGTSVGPENPPQSSGLEDKAFHTKRLSVPSNSSPKKEHKCPFCGTGFARHHHLKSHLLKHCQTNPHTCSSCSSRFRSMRDLKPHERLQIGSVTPYICNTCHREFAQKDILARHMKTTSGETKNTVETSSIADEENYYGNLEPTANGGSPKDTVSDEVTEFSGPGSTSRLFSHLRAQGKSHGGGAVLKEASLQQTLRTAQPSRILSSEELALALQAAPDPAQIQKIWTLNSFFRWEDPHLREKFLVYYHEPQNQWTQVTVSIDYGNLQDGSFENSLIREPSVNKRSAWLYSVLRPTLLGTQFYSTMTNFEIKTQDDGQLAIWKVEDTEWAIKDYPSARMGNFVLAAPKVRESDIELQSQISPYIYWVRVNSNLLVRHDIAGPSADGVEGVISGLRRLRHCCTESVVQLQGEVLDDTSTYVKGILFEPLNRRLQWARRGPVTLNQCLRWAFQIVVGFRDALFCGFTLAEFDFHNIFADKNDRAKLWISLSDELSQRYFGPYTPPSEENFEVREESAANMRRLGHILESLIIGGPPPVDSPEVPMWLARIIQACKNAHQSDATPVDKMIEDILTLIGLHVHGHISRETTHDPEVDAGDVFTGSDDDDVFDTQSVMSLETAITSSSGYGNLAQIATLEFVDLLYEAVDVCALAVPRVEANLLDVDRFRHRVRRLIKLLSKDLSNELTEGDQRDVSAFFMSASRPIATAIISRAGLKVGTEVIIPQTRDVQEPDEFPVLRTPINDTPVQNEPEVAEISDAESEASEVDVEEQEATVNLAVLRDTVAASTAFIVFVKSLQDLICPTFESKLLRMSQVAKEREDDLDPDGNLREVLSELLYSRPLHISLAESDAYSWADRAKDYVEASTEQPWDWWPLTPKRISLPKDQVKLTWKCLCGETRTAHVRKSHAKYIIKVRNEAANESTQRSHDEPKNANTGSGGSAMNSQQRTSQSCPSAGSSRSSYVPSPSSTFMGSQVTSPLGKGRQSRYIPMMVSSGPFLLNEIESQDLCNEALFNKIRDAYGGAKGVTRWFTTTKFSHCEFFKFEEWSRRRYCERGPGIPPKEATEYYYVPRPMDREPPISRHEFHDRFYRKVPGEDCQFGVPRNICSDRDAVDRIPQINKPVSISDRKRQQFYGIVAREKKSGLMMMLYILLCSIPGTIFFFLWVFQWGHDSLQDASILLVLSWTLLGLLYAAQFL